MNFFAKENSQSKTQILSAVSPFDQTEFKELTIEEPWGIKLGMKRTEAESHLLCTEMWERADC